MKRMICFQQLLVIVTAVASMLLIAIGVIYESSFSTPTKKLMTEGHPHIGYLDAKIEVILVEDLRCKACYYFFEDVFPQIYEKYIKTGQAVCVFVPVSFLNGSRPLGNAAIAVYHIAPDRFMDYVHEVFEYFNLRESNGLEKKDLLMLAERVGGIDLDQLAECIESNRYAAQLDQNFDWAKSIMGNRFGTPALYINGIRTSTASFDSFTAQVEKLERKR